MGNVKGRQHKEDLGMDGRMTLTQDLFGSELRSVEILQTRL
jgi:hypothetical protein